MFVNSKYTPHDQLFAMHLSLFMKVELYKVTAFCLPLTVDSGHSDIVHQELIWQCQSEVRGAAVSCSHWVSRWHCWFILNVIVDGSTMVEWGEPVQFNSTPSCANDGQNVRLERTCGQR